MEYPEFFREVAGDYPYPYQTKLGTGPWPDLLNIPTGMGKTAGIVVAWLYKILSGDSNTPCRLVYCLPMRALVEQTYSNVCRWLKSVPEVFGFPNNSGLNAHLMLGGEADTAWVERPEQPAAIIGTQDMLLSRALMRGYGMSRFQWPIHFALLHQDALWIYDEIQLMGQGLPTSAQLDAFRRDFPGHASMKTKSVWISATLNPSWLETVDFKSRVADLKSVSLSESDYGEAAVIRKVSARKRLTVAKTPFSAGLLKNGAKEYAERLSGEIAEAHRSGSNTIAIFNTVDRAQAVFRSLAKKKHPCETLLLHARFRPSERRDIQSRLTKKPGDAGRIVIATQAVEAGVDISSAVLFTELAPWSSLVQRFGRCNRYGECDEAEIVIIRPDEFKSGMEQPYQTEDLRVALEKLEVLRDVSISKIPQVTEPVGVSHVIRKKDFLELFNTDPDLFGFDADVSVYVRDTGIPRVQVFWRDFEKGPEEETSPRREELCPVSMGQIGSFLKKKGRSAFRWDLLTGKWRRTNRAIPGSVLLLKASDGGYDTSLGFWPESKAKVPVAEDGSRSSADAFGEDFGSIQTELVLLSDHSKNVAEETSCLCERLGIEEKDCLVRAAFWHDVGKSHPVFRKTMTACMEDSGQRRKLWAKSFCRGRHGRPFFRHELASALAWIAHADSNPENDLVAYLIAAHHGKVRLGLRAVPGEKRPDDGQRFARGVWEGDVLPELPEPDFVGMRETILNLDPMEMGDGDFGASWRTRVQGLIDRYGPFRLAYLESVLRIADWRASRKEQERKKNNGK